MGVADREIDAFAFQLSSVGELQWQAAHNIIVTTQTTVDRRSNNAGTRRISWAGVVEAQSNCVTLSGSRDRFRNLDFIVVNAEAQIGNGARRYYEANGVAVRLFRLDIEISTRSDVYLTRSRLRNKAD